MRGYRSALDHDAAEEPEARSGTGIAPGKRTLTQGLPGRPGPLQARGDTRASTAAMPSALAPPPLLHTVVHEEPDAPLVKPTEAEAGRAAQGAGPWWHAREDCMAGGEAHSLYFLGSPGQIQLVINPNPKYLKDWIEDAKRHIAPTALGGQQLGELIGMVERVQKIADSKEKDKQVQITAELRKIATALAALGVTTGDAGMARPPTHVAFETATDTGAQYCVRMTASVLSVDPGNSPGGSPPEEKSTWGQIHTTHPSFVRGHMLNKHLHGPGTADNLTPITDAVNRTMSSDVEEKVKAHVLERNGVAEYRVVAAYDGHGAKKGYTDYQRRVIPTRITCSWRPLTRAGDGEWKPTGDLAVTPIDQVLPDTDTETKRGHQRGHQHLGKFLDNPKLKPKKKAGKTERAMYALASGGQRRMDAYQAESKAPAVTDEDMAAMAEYQAELAEMEADADTFESVEGGGDDRDDRDADMGGDMF